MLIEGKIKIKEDQNKLMPSFGKAISNKPSKQTNKNISEEERCDDECKKVLK